MILPLNSDFSIQFYMKNHDFSIYFTDYFSDFSNIFTLTFKMNEIHQKSWTPSEKVV